MKNKHFLCFRPVGIETETEPHTADRFNDQVLTCITVSSHKDSKFSVLKSPSSPVKKSKLSEREAHSKSFSGVIKAVLFEISLRKKARSRKSPGSISSDSSKSDGISEKLQSPDTRSPRIRRESFESSSNSCSFSQSSPTQNQKKQSAIGNSHEDKITGSSNTHVGLFLILVSLAITVFYGRLCAVMFASLCLYFLSHRRICLLPEKMVGLSLEKESAARDYRKRVIMEGLLERNYQRRGH